MDVQWGLRAVARSEEKPDENSNELLRPLRWDTTEEKLREVGG
jgi:hypothetical protein